MGILNLSFFRGIVVALIFSISIAGFAQTAFPPMAAYPMGLTANGAGAGFVAGGNSSAGFAKKLSEKCGVNPVCWTMVAMSVAQAVQYIVGFFKSDDSDVAACANGRCNFQGPPNPNLPNSNLDNTTNRSRVGNLGNGTYRQLLYGRDVPKTQALEDLRELDQDLKGLENQLAEQGISIDHESGSIQTPRGTFSKSQLSTLAGLQAMGATAKDLQLLEKIASEEKAALGRSYKNTNTGGDDVGFRKPAAADSSRDTDDLNSYMARILRQQRGPASKDSLAGLAVIRNGEPIGISQSNIFETISQRYIKLKDNGEVGLQK